MSPDKRRIQETDESNLVGNLRGEVGEAVTSWALWRLYRIQQRRNRPPDIQSDLENAGFQLLNVLVDRLRNDVTARLSELGEKKIGSLNFHFLGVKRPEFQIVAEDFATFVVSKGIRDKRNRDISHKELPPKWNDHRSRYVNDRLLTRGTALALRTMKYIDRKLIGPESPYLWQVMRRRRYQPTSPPSAGYLLLPFIVLPTPLRFQLAEAEFNEASQHHRGLARGE